ncbi:hypothetical protein TrCOL_g11668 [Triparma columacea]|uniref:Methyltransferase domain-containing protein n=1 Tax=Triparma columacea TaxID=722753 RepID=A0A9W7GCG4_9STRA|nr:hypothetical protein TrCOL_g11668 [Triparma columacea]
MGCCCCKQLLSIVLLVIVVLVQGLDNIDDVETKHNRKNLVNQYSMFPYPMRERTDSFGINSVDLPTVSYWCFEGRYSSVWRRPDLRILDAGGGTGDSTLTLAQQLHDIGNLDARIVHLDLSPTSQAITKERAEYHEIGHMVEFALGSFLDEDLMASLGTFDFIVCHGVLHHQADPGAGLRALKLALRPGGAINIMVYGDLGRTGIYDVQRMMRLMKESESSDEQWSPQLDEQEEVDSLRDLLGALPETSRVRRNEPFWESVEGEVATGAGAFDLFLHSQDRAYTVRELYEWVEGEAGLTMVGFNEGGLYKPALWLSPSASDELLERVNDLDERRKMDMAELLHGAIQRHSFYVEDGEKREIPEVMPMAIPCLPRRGQIHMDFDIIKQHNDFTVDVSMDVSYASSVLPKPTMVEYKKVSALIQYPWIFGDCQKTFTDIWRGLPEDLH